jgi:hypothetical protein
MQTETIKIKVSKTSDILIKIAAVVGAITVIAGGYTWYINTLWKPSVEVVSVDFETGTSTLKVGGKTILLQGDSTYYINADWGIRFGMTRVDNKVIYNRLELTKKGMVYEYLER